MAKIGLPEVILDVADEMRELLYLRKRVDDLETERRQGLWNQGTTKTIHDLLDGTVYKVTPNQDGKWEFSFDWYNHPTGGSAYDTPEQAFRRMLEHIANCWELRERELREDED